MSLFSRLFGKSDAPPEESSSEEYKGFRITPDPQPEGKQFRLAARIEKEVAGEQKVHHLIRADVIQDRDAAATAALSKAKQVIDEQGEALFR